MPHRTFLMFILPSLLAMLVFIAAPVVSVAIQSLFVAHDKVMVEVESCGPFGCTKDMHVDSAATDELQKKEPLGKFNGLGTYTDRNHLAFAEVGAILCGQCGPWPMRRAASTRSRSTAPSPSRWSTPSS